MAMQWVQENIVAFGGDMNNVMVYGESAGAGSVTNHLVMQKSFQFYSSAILESGSFVQWVTQPLWNAQNAYDTLLKEVKCHDVACLLEKTTEEIYQASLGIGSSDIAYGTPYNPTVDGVELFTHPWISAAEGDVADVPILHGTNLDEGSMFVPLPYDVEEAGLVAYWSLFMSKTDIVALKELYLTGENAPTYPSVRVDGVQVSQYWWAADRSMADGSFYCGAKYSSVQLSRHQRDSNRDSSTFLYNFDYLADGSEVPFVQHTNEIPFMLHDNACTASPADESMADLMAGYWGAFLTHHDPNINNNPDKSAKSLPVWEAYDSDLDNLLKISGSGAGGAAEALGVNRQECDFFIPWTDADIRDMFPSPFHYHF
jgi:carboxylesterase type B